MSTLEQKAKLFVSRVQAATTAAQRDECFALLRELKLLLADLSHVSATSRQYTPQQQQEIAIARERERERERDFL
jgi:hypothetical protein